MRKSGLFVAMLLALAATAAFAKTWRVGVVSVHDGDTFLSDREVFGKRQKIRLLGINTPEIDGAKCAEERAAGVAARDFLSAQMLAAGNKATLRKLKEDKYGGRWDAQVMLSINGKAVDAALLLLSAGHGVAYKGGARDPMMWCAGAGQ